ncbi:MAG TPA: plasmid stabilization protein [Mycobacteriales bacterium]|nr:plasmid stabilization protein [Mycobacteriales bacterium]
MATITVRNIDESLKAKLRVRAAEHGWSMEEEMRAILRSALSDDEGGGGLASRIRERFADIGYVELELPERRDFPRPVQFDE